MPDKREALSTKECILVLSKMPCLTGKRFPQLQEYVRECDCRKTGYRSDNVMPEPHCPLCNGTGYIVTEPPIRVAFEISREILRDVSAEWLATYKPWEKHMSCPPDLYWNAVLEEAEDEQDANG